MLKKNLEILENWNPQILWLYVSLRLKSIHESFTKPVITKNFGP